jgi:hypothetical protein
MHIIADSSIGIGVHGILCIWLCLLQGLRYHTADMARKRAENRKQQVELWGTINYLRTSSQPIDNTSRILSDNNQSYYDEYGDFNGSGVSWGNMRMKHDPCGDHWPDFLLPKMLLFLLGASSVVISTYFRFHDDSTVDEDLLIEYHDIYAITYLLQIFILSIWVGMIIRAALKTGKALRNEPFLSTRPAQLAFRILMSMLILGATSVFILFSADICSLIKECESTQRFIEVPGSKDSDRLIYWNSRDYTWGESRHILIQIMIRVALYAKQRVPYIGTAASLGAGEILFITVSTLTIAFIFLPSTDFILNSDHPHIAEKRENNGLIHKENQRRDKRALITLSRYTHTWRVFPCPIDRHQKPTPRKLNTVDHYELDRNFQLTSNKWGPGTIYKNNYTAVFCIETALWLLECSWQTCKFNNIPF